MEEPETKEVVFLGKLSGPSNEGYGDLNGYRYQLMVMNVEEMKPLRLAQLTTVGLQF